MCRATPRFRSGPGPAHPVTRAMRRGVAALRRAALRVRPARTLLSIAIRGTGSPGPVETLLTDVQVDDLDIGSDGTVYLSSHPEDVLCRRPGAPAVRIAGPDESVLGSTAVALDADEVNLIVVTDGAFVMADLPDEPARIVRLEVSGRCR